MTKNKPSSLMRLMSWFMKIRGSNFTKQNFPRWEKKMLNRTYPKPAPIPGWIKRKTELDVWSVDGHPAYTLRPIGVDSKVDIIYTHGGAYVLPLQFIHWLIVYELVKRGAVVTVPTYGLAPEHDYQGAYKVLEKVYRKVLSTTDPKKLILCGDSAGGGLALGQALHFREIGLPLPARIILFSPWLDVTLENPEIPNFAARDLMLAAHGLRVCGHWWSGGDDPRSPLISPLFADLNGLPPIDCFMGTDEILLPDAVVLDERVKDGGGEMNLHVYAGGFHDFVAASFTREAQNVFGEIARTIELF